MIREENKPIFEIVQSRIDVLNALLEGKTLNDPYAFSLLPRRDQREMWEVLMHQKTILLSDWGSALWAFSASLAEVIEPPPHLQEVRKKRELVVCALRHLQNDLYAFIAEAKASAESRREAVGDGSTPMGEQHLNVLGATPLQTQTPFATPDGFSRSVPQEVTRQEKTSIRERVDYWMNRGGIALAVIVAGILLLRDKPAPPAPPPEAATQKLQTTAERPRADTARPNSEETTRKITEERRNHGKPSAATSSTK